MTMYYKNKTYYFELALINNQGNFVTGKTINYEVYKSSDDSLITSGTMTEVGITGVYKFYYSFANTGQYRIQYNCPNKYEDLIEMVLIEEDVELIEIYNQVKRVLGLSQDNIKITDEKYDSYNNLIESTVNMYPSATDLENDTNLLYQYKMTSTWNNKRQMREYKYKRIL